MRQANWHEVGGNAKVLKGTEEDALKDHAPPPRPGPHSGRGTQSGGQPGHVEALYPKITPRKRAQDGARRSGV